MRPISENKYILADKMIKAVMSRHKLCNGPEDCYSESWRNYLEARKTYHRFEGCCSFETYAEFLVEKGFEEMRKRHNDLISLKSKISLDECYLNSGESIIDHLPGRTGDCVKYVELMDYIGRLQKDERSVAISLYYGMTDQEIMEEKYIKPKQYYRIIEQLQKDFTIGEQFVKTFFLIF